MPTEKQIRDDECRACANMLDLNPSQLRLMAGEMNAGEIRTTTAILNALKRAILRRCGVVQFDFTPWFPVFDKPVRDGVYQINCPKYPNNNWSRFQAGIWYCTSVSYEGALISTEMSSDMYAEGVTWRGLVHE